MTTILTPEELLGNPEHGLVPAARDAQMRLVAFLKETLHSKTPAAAEAGTGVGKSYGYLSHAMHLASTKKVKVIVSTAMKSLQQQIFFKDLPALEKYYPEVDFARRLGKKNYGCKRRVHLHVEDTRALKVYNEFFDETLHWIWSDAPEGMRLPENHDRYSVEYCSKTRCDWYEECSQRGYLNAKDAMNEAQILVVNHALVAADMRVFNQHGIDILPDADYLIIDEAHKFVESVRDALSCALTERYYHTLDKKYRQLWDTAEAAARNSEERQFLQTLPETLPDLELLGGAYADMFFEARQTRGMGPLASAYARHARRTQQGLKRRLGLGTPEMTAFLAGGEPPAHLPKALQYSPVLEVLSELDTFADTLEFHAGAIDHTTEDRLHHVLAISDSKLTITPLEVAKDLNGYYERRQMTPTYLSATLTVNDKFDHFARDVGLRSTETQPVRAKSIGSPFNYEKQAWGYFPAHLPLVPKNYAPDAEKAAYYDALSDEMYDLLMANEGHAFILLTSREDLGVYEAALRKRKYPYPLMVQSEEMKASARKQFMATPHATLLGLKSFWEGIDIPGLQLSLVIIPKFPFPHPNDAVIQAKVRLAPDSHTGFREVQLPHMLQDLRQMAGRAIRTTTDLGVVAVLDSRGAKKSYGADVVKAVGFPKWGSNKATAIATLQRITERRKQRAGL